MSKLVLVDGYICGSSLVIKNCPLCGYPHHHGNPTPGYKIGDMTSRVPHCHDWNTSSVIIQIVGEITKSEEKRLMNKKRPFKEKAELKYIDYESYRLGAN
jgi:hypothetical protein